MITPRISMVAYDCRTPGFIFVAIPNEKGRYVRTDKSVALSACPLCGAQIGEPCLRSGNPGSPTARYGGGTHYLRRNAVPWGAKAHDMIGDWSPDPTPDEVMEAAS